jgi:hypothetical protein
MITEKKDNIKEAEGAKYRVVVLDNNEVSGIIEGDSNTYTATKFTLLEFNKMDDVDDYIDKQSLAFREVDIKEKEKWDIRIITVRDKKEKDKKEKDK